jgi:hypothetical protein
VSRKDVLDGDIFLALEDLNRVLHILGRQGIAALQELIELLQRPVGQFYLGFAALNGNLVAPVGQLHPQQAAEEAEIVPLLPEQGLGLGVVRQGELGRGAWGGGVGGFHSGYGL